MITSAAPTDPHAPMRVDDAPVLHLSAPWLHLAPWVWRCPDCRVTIRGESEDAAYGAARAHRTKGHAPQDG